MKLKRDLSLTLEERFWLRVDKSGDCWLWTGGGVPKGYGSFKFRSHTWRVHRLSWTLHNGPIPEGLHVLHRCDNPPCVRPEHLFLGTNADNVRDRDAKGRRSAPRGSDNGRAKLTPEQVEEIRRTYRRYVAGCGSSALAQKYGVHHKSILAIVAGKAYV